MSLTIHNPMAIEAVNAVVPVQSLADRMKHEHSRADVAPHASGEPKPAPASAASSAPQSNSTAQSSGAGQGAGTSSAPSSAAAPESSSVPEPEQEPSGAHPDPVELPESDLRDPCDVMPERDTREEPRDEAEGYIERVVPRKVLDDRVGSLPVPSPASDPHLRAPQRSEAGAAGGRPQPLHAHYALTQPWSGKGSALPLPMQAMLASPTANALAPQVPAAPPSAVQLPQAATVVSPAASTLAVEAAGVNRGDSAAPTSPVTSGATTLETKVHAQSSGPALETGTAAPAPTLTAQVAATRQAGDAVASEAGQARNEANAATQRSVQHVQQAQKTQEALAQRARAESRVEVSFNSWGAGHSVVGRQQNGQWVMTPSTARVGMALSNSAVPDGLQVRVAGAGDRVDAGSATDADGRRRQQHEHDTP